MTAIQEQIISAITAQIEFSKASWLRDCNAPYFYRWANTTQIAFRLTMQSVQVRYYCEQLVKAGQLVSERNPGWINRYSLPSLEGYCIKGDYFHPIPAEQEAAES